MNAAPTCSYKLKYLIDGDDMDPKTLISSRQYSPGDVIRAHGDWGFFHLVAQVQVRPQETRLVLSKSAQSAEEARLLAAQHGHWPAA